MKRIVVVLLLTLSVVIAQTKPISEVTKLRLVSAYQRYILATVALQRAQQQMPDAAANYNSTVTKAIEDEKLPKGTQFNINIETGDVSIVPPGVAAPEPKPEPKK